VLFRRLAVLFPLASTIACGQSSSPASPDDGGSPASDARSEGAPGDASVGDAGTSDVAIGDAPVGDAGMPSGALVRFTNDDPFLPLLPPVGAIHLDQPAPGSMFKAGPGEYWMMVVTEDWYSATHSLGYSTSQDGLVWSQPQIVMAPTLPWENDLWGGPVLLENGTYKMWYQARSAGSPNLGRTGYATSPDRINWTKNPDPILDVGATGTWDDTRAFAHDVFADGKGGYRMYVMGSSSVTKVWRTGIATSSDGIAWTQAAGNPLPGIAMFATVTYDAPTGRYYAWYNDDKDATINFAWSADGITWTDGPNNPVLTVSTDANAYDSAGFNGGLVVLRDGNVYRIFYTGTKALDPALGQWPEYELMAEVNADGSPTVAPTVAARASVSSATATGASLSVLGADVGGEAGLVYTWSSFQNPPGAADPVFSANRSNAAKSVTATFGKPGSYRLRAIVTNPATNLSVASDVTASIGTYEQTFPTVATPPKTSAAATTKGTPVTLSILGADAAGEGSLKYYWQASYTSPFTVTYSDNATNTAKQTSASFTVSGTYMLHCFVVNAVGLNVLSQDVTVTVN
jgi:hypothetical protein